MGIYVGENPLSVPGMSAYQEAIKGGFAGTREDFDKALKDLPDHLTDEVRHITAEERTSWNNKAPGGFGLGANGSPYAYTVLTADTINTINRSGLYVYDDNDNSIDAGLGNYGGSGLLLHLAHTAVHSYDAKQVFYPRTGMGNAYLERVKDMDKGWFPWEWVNPPMQLGVEYRTTERYLSKPVYAQLMDFGHAPAQGSTKIIAFPNNSENQHLVRAHLTYYGITFPKYNSDGTVSMYINVSPGTGYFHIYSPGEDRSDNGTIRALIKYTKIHDA